MNLKPNPTNESAVFTITVLKDGSPLENVMVKYQVGPEKMDSLVLKKGTLTLPGFSLKIPGFLQCTATAYL